MQTKEKDQPQMLLPGVYDELPDPLPFQGIEKSQVLQGTKIFADPTIDEKKCLHILVQLLYIHGQGETFSTTAATDIFFATTKLFQSPNQDLRRLTYLVMKCLSSTAEQTFMATQTLCKDINSSNAMYKANAIRTIRKITDASMLGPGDRFLKQCVVDKDTTVASAAIVTGMHLSKTTPETIKKWSSEVREALNCKSEMVQYHALALLHKFNKNDRLFVLKLVQSVPLRSHLAICLLIRMCAEILQEDFTKKENNELYQFVVKSLRHGSDMVQFEAAKAICSLRGLTAKDLNPVAIVLGLNLHAMKPVLKFATLRLLNKMASTHPLAITSCLNDMETLFADSNRNIATLAISTMLKTGSEHSIERLLKQISRFLDGIPDEFKTVVIDSMRILSKKFPHQHHLLTTFLHNALREGGGIEYKTSVVEAIINLIETIPDAKQNALSVLCELIEDCEFDKISQRVLCLLGQECPLQPNPNKYVRFIYNRVLLEAASVRAAAVSALSKFGAACPALRDSVITLLQRAAKDSDDEVRDRAIFYITLLETNDEGAVNMFINDVAKEVKEAAPPVAVAVEGEVAPPPQEKSGLGAMLKEAETEVQSKWVQEMEKIPELRKLGKPFKTSEPQSLTEKDDDYVVTCVKHAYHEYVVMHFHVMNNTEAIFTNVMVKVDLSGDEDLATMTPLHAFPIKSVPPGGQESCYISFKRDEEAGFPYGACRATLSFAIKEDEDDEAGEVDDYELPEEVVVNLSDYLRGKPVPDFEAEWEKLADEDTTATYDTGVMKPIQEATNEILDFYTFTPSGDCDKVPKGKVSHVIMLSGQMCAPDPIDFLIKAKVFLTESQTSAITISVRGGDDDLRTMLQESLLEK